MNRFLTFFLLLLVFIAASIFLPVLYKTVVEHYKLTGDMKMAPGMGLTIVWCICLLSLVYPFADKIKN